MAYLLNRRNWCLSFIIVGPVLDTQKEYSRRVERLAKQLGVKNLVFYGCSNNVPSVLKAADIYVCSSIAEASPIAVWEAMAMAKPVVSTDVGDVMQFIRPGKSGFVVPTRNPEALADKVGSLIENEELRKVFGKRAREMAVNYLDIDVCVRRHAEFYRHIMGSQSA
jgi:glycosyltransferase involved in cell wall biosynthesis